MTLNAIVDLLARAERLARNPSPVLQAEAAAILARVERHLPAAQLEPEVDCAECWRPARCWFATGVEDGKLHPLCCRACVGSWRQFHVGAVFMGYGRRWQDELPARRAA